MKKRNTDPLNQFKDRRLHKVEKPKPTDNSKEAIAKWAIMSDQEVEQLFPSSLAGGTEVILKRARE